MENIQKKLSRILLGGGVTKHIASVDPIPTSELTPAMRHGTGVIFSGIFTNTGSNTLENKVYDEDAIDYIADPGVFNPFGFSAVQGSVLNGQYNLVFSTSDKSQTYNIHTIIPKLQWIKRDSFSYAKSRTAIKCSIVDNSGTTRGFQLELSIHETVDGASNLATDDSFFLEVLKLD